MRGERRRGRLAVGAGDRHEFRPPAARRSRQKISMSPMISTPAGFGRRRVQAAQDASTPGGAKHEGDENSTSPATRGRQAKPFGEALTRAAWPLSSQTETLARLHATRARSRAGTAQPNSATCLPAKRVAEIIQRTLQVERPISASTKAMIQKRTTICGPHLSAELFEMMMDRAMRKMRFFSLNDTTWTITDSAFQHEQAADDHGHDLVL